MINIVRTLPVPASELLPVKVKGFVKRLITVTFPFKSVKLRVGLPDVANRTFSANVSTSVKLVPVRTPALDAGEVVGKAGAAPPVIDSENVPPAYDWLAYEYKYPEGIVS